MATAASCNNLLRSELECPICQDVYDNPIELHCKHNFCRECLLTYVRNQPFHRDYWTCPFCRERCSISFDSIKAMPVNLKLRNIVSAVDKNSTILKDACGIHNSAYVIYCHDCSDVKCLSCFMKTCKTEHNTKELAELTDELQGDITSKLDQCKSKLFRFDDLKSKLEKLSLLAGKSIGLIKKLRQQHDQGVNEITRKLEQMQRLDPSELALQQTALSSITFPELNEDAKSFEDMLADLDSYLEKTVCSFENIVEQHRDSVPETDSATSESYMPTTEAIAASRVSDAEVMRSLDVIFSRYQTYNAMFDSEDDTNSFNDMDGDYDDDDYSFGYGGYDDDDDSEWTDEDISVISFDDEVVESISAVGRTVYVCSNKRISRVEDDNVHVMMRGKVMACAAIDDSKILISYTSHVLVFKYDRNIGKRLFVLPDQPIGSVCITSLGVSASYPKRYFLADSKHHCIHVWDSGYRRWETGIDVKTLADHQKPSFSISVFGDNIYMSLYFQRKIMAVSTTGQVLWQTCDQLSGPYGIFVDASSVYVCDRSCGVGIFDAGGNFLRKIEKVEDHVDEPWSVAKVEDKLYVLERFYKHDISRSRIKLHIFKHLF